MHLENRRTVCRGGENQNGTSGRGGGGKASPGKIVPYYQRTGKWCKEEYGHTVDKSPIAKAMFYMYTRFEQLSGYVNDAQFCIDNNPVERSIRPLTLNRKIRSSPDHMRQHMQRQFSFH